ncbi:MAG: DcaP family trimeric outer membrane transporter [Rikenellaceae bacterium]
MKKILLSMVALWAAITISFAETKTEKSNPLEWSAGNTTATIGGFIHVVALTDFGGAIDSYNFIPAYTAVQEKWQNDSRSQISASFSRLNFGITQKTEKLGDIKGYIEMDFRGVSGTVLRLRHAYVSFLGLTIGQTTSFATDSKALAETVDRQGSNSRTNFRTPLIGYRQKLGKSFTAALSLEHPSALIFTGDYFKSAIDDSSAAAAITANIGTASQRSPDVILYLMSSGSLGHIKATGIYRNLSYHNLLTEKVESRTGYGAELTGSLKPAKWLTLYGQALYGKGIAKYIHDLSRIAVDLIPDNSANGTMEAVGMYGGSVGVKAQLSPTVFATSNFSRAVLEDGGESLYYPLLYSHGDYLSASLFWSVINNMTLGAEYLFGSHTTLNGSYAQANRLQLMIRYNF